MYLRFHIQEIYEKLLELRAHGIKRLPDFAPWYYEMHSLGFNYRITDMQATLGISQLKKLDSFVKRRKEIASKYDEAFFNSIVKLLYSFNQNSSYHLFVVKVDFSKLNISKVELFNKMREKNIGLQLHYIPINKQPFYKNLGYGDEKTPIMNKYYDECFSLPMYPSLSEDEQEYVIKNLLEFLK